MELTIGGLLERQIGYQEKRNITGSSSEFNEWCVQKSVNSKSRSIEQRILKQSVSCSKRNADEPCWYALRSNDFPVHVLKIVRYTVFLCNTIFENFLKRFSSKHIHNLAKFWPYDTLSDEEMLAKPIITFRCFASCTCALRRSSHSFSVFHKWKKANHLKSSGSFFAVHGCNGAEYPKTLRSGWLHMPQNIGRTVFIRVMNAFASWMHPLLWLSEVQLFLIFYAM